METEGEQQKLLSRKSMTIVRWNVRETEKLNIVEKELIRQNIYIWDIAKTERRNQANCKTKNHTI